MEWVSFPGIGIGKIFIKDYAFVLFGLKIKWYAIIICTGMMLAVWIGLTLSKKFGVKKEDILDNVIIGIVFGIIGGRIFYVIFNFSQFSNNLWEIFNLRGGGIAIYGGIIFSCIFAYFYCKIKKMRFLPILDISGICFLLGQAIGRWGNFFNIEAYGEKTNLPWGMTSSKILEEKSPVHPTFFYESIWCFIGFLLLIFLMKYRKFDGQMFLNYVIWYSFGRFFIEGVRADSLWLVEDVFRVSQVLSFFFFFISIAIEVYFLFFYMTKNKDKNFLYVKEVKEKTRGR